MNVKICQIAQKILIVTTQLDHSHVNAKMAIWKSMKDAKVIQAQH